MRTLHVIILATILSVTAFGIFYYKFARLEFPLTPDKTYNSWYVEARMNVTAGWRNAKGENPATLKLHIPPSNSNRYAIVEEKFVASGFGEEIDAHTKDGNRNVTFSKRQIDRNEAIFYRAMVYELDSPADVAPPSTRPPVTSPYAPGNRPPVGAGPLEDPLLIGIDAVVEEARARSADERSYVREILKLVENGGDDRLGVINDALHLQSDRVRLAQILIEANNIPTRTVHGIHLTTDQRNTRLQAWLDVFVEGKWQSIDPLSFRFGLDDKYLVWWFGDDTLYSADGLRKLDVGLSVRQNTDKALTRAIWKSGEIADVLLKFSFYNLPLESQLLFQVLLMIPVGGLVIAILRQFVGIRTFGTFMPVLVALAFRETGLMNGIILFVTIVALGLLVRAYFARLQLLLVPRLASVLTVVVLILSMVTMVANNLNMVIGLSISLFPIVILTMTIERISLMWDEYGAKTAIKTSIGSLFSAILSYLIMYQETLNHIFFAFPELLLVVLSITLLMGRYNGYKLTEYFRFKALQMELERKKKA
ncbi:MAG: UUP1 family membrane protein [Rickettsiales bacterium]|nr:UUP1 family membrane protein [Rickettsiales bacterium]